MVLLWVPPFVCLELPKKQLRVSSPSPRCEHEAGGGGAGDVQSLLREMEVKEKEAADSLLFLCRWRAGSNLEP